MERGEEGGGMPSFFRPGPALCLAPLIPHQVLNLSTDQFIDKARTLMMTLRGLLTAPLLMTVFSVGSKLLTHECWGIVNDHTIAHFLLGRLEGWQMPGSFSFPVHTQEE